jgi:hypothetical protein
MTLLGEAASSALPVVPEPNENLERDPDQSIGRERKH